MKVLYKIYNVVILLYKINIPNIISIFNNLLNYCFTMKRIVNRDIENNYCDEKIKNSNNNENIKNCNNNENIKNCNNNENIKNCNNNENIKDHDIKINHMRFNNNENNKKIKKNISISNLMENYKKKMIENDINICELFNDEIIYGSGYGQYIYHGYKDNIITNL
jgi:hypothetical protein